MLLLGRLTRDMRNLTYLLAMVLGAGGVAACGHFAYVLVSDSSPGEKSWLYIIVTALSAILSATSIAMSLKLHRTVMRFNIAAFTLVAIALSPTLFIASVYPMPITLLYAMACVGSVVSAVLCASLRRARNTGR